jgi:5-methylcytosine-specific restriction endonuclease McrA
MPCAACGSRNDVHVDHIIPVSKGGTSERSNLQPLCYWCNGIKGGRIMTNQQILDRYPGRSIKGAT